MLSALAPARRRLVVGVAGLAVAAALAVGVVVVVGKSGGAPAAPPDRPGPVLLVPGYGGSTAVLDSLAARLRAAGRDARVVPLPGSGTGDLRVQATALDAAARQAAAGPRVSL